MWELTSQNTLKPVSPHAQIVLCVHFFGHTHGVSTECVAYFVRVCVLTAYVAYCIPGII